MAWMMDMVWVLAQSSSGLGGVLKFFGLSPTMLLIIVVGLVVAILAWWLVKFVYKHREKAKELTMIRRLFASTSGGPAAGADPAKRAAIDNMRRSFEEGVEKFRAAGKNVYTLPWVLLAGPSGSGKTEAIRHCNVGFPPGLQNYLQGAGGTLNMHWWFTNDAVILDTAGRIFMESAGQGGGDEWRELLKMLKDVRPLCPINGLLLCIGVDSLIKDSGDDIQEKAGKIAQQLDTIQRTLDVRFPVFVVVTKCDLITGFREFFENVTDPQLQHQMLGWSNPSALDTVFNPEQVSEHIESVRQRLLRRRYALTIDPVHTDDPQARRTDQVDALYALPDSLARLSSRLRRYLELIFVQGEWSPKPLFLRGIYFTSSMRQGAELDEELAKMLGVSVDKLPGGVSEEKSYFLRDVFKEKVFKEKGLVTRATNVDKQQARQRLMVVGSAIAAAVVLLGCTLYSSYSFRENVGHKEESWYALWSNAHDLSPIGVSGAALAYREKADVKVGLNELTRAGALAKGREEADTPPGVPFMLRPMNLVKKLGDSDVTSKSKQAAASLIVRSAVAPLVEQARKKLVTEPADGSAWTDEATAVLTGLIRIERKEKGEVGQTPIDADAFLRYVLPPDQYAAAQKESKQLQDLVAWAYSKDGGEAEWPGKAEGSLSLGTEPGVIARGVAAFNAHWSNVTGTGGPLGKLRDLQAKAAAFEGDEKKLKSHGTGVVKNLREGENSYERFEADWKTHFGALLKSKESLAAACSAAGYTGSAAELEKLISAAGDQILRQAASAYAQVLDEPAPEAGGGLNLPTGVSSKADQLANQGKQAADKAGKIGDALGLNSKDWADAMKDRQKELRGGRDGLSASIGAQIEKMKTELKASAGTGVLARPEPGGKFEFEKRFGAYSAANDAVLASAAPETGQGPRWGELGAGEAERAKPFAAADDSIRREYQKAAEGGEDAGSYSLSVSGLARRAARTRAVLSALSGTDNTTEWVKERVSSLAEKPPAGAEPLLPATAMIGKLDLPGAPMASATAAKGYEPNGAALVLGDFEYVRPKSVKDAAGGVLLDGALTRQLDAGEVALKSYASSYVDAWTKEPLKNARPEFESWEAARSAGASLSQNYASWADKLLKLETLMQKAIGVPGLASLLGEGRGKELADWSAKLSADAGTLGNIDSPLSKAMPLQIGKFAELPASAFEARNRLAQSSSLVKDYFSNLDPKVLEGGVQGLGEFYFSHARVGMLRALAKSYDSDTKRIRFEQEQKFPLAFEPSAIGAGSLTSERVQEIVKALPPSGAGNAADAAGPGAPGRTGIPAVDEELDRLFKPDPFLSTHQNLAKAMRSWGDWLAQAPTVTIVAIEDHGYNWIPGTDKLRGSDGRDADIAGAIYTQLRVNQEQASNRDGGKVLAKNLSVYAGESPTLVFEMSDGNAQRASWSPATPWQTLELLCQNGVRPAGSDWRESGTPDAASKRWLVPVFFKGQDGRAYFILVGLEFSVEVPSKRNWPTADKWN